MASPTMSYRLSSIYSSYVVLLGVIMEFVPALDEERGFGEFRRKLRSSELLSRRWKTIIRNSFYGPGQRGGAEWPRAEIRLRGGLLPKPGLRCQVLGLRTEVSGLRLGISGFVTERVRQFNYIAKQVIVRETSPVSGKPARGLFCFGRWLLVVGGWETHGVW